VESFEVPSPFPPGRMTPLPDRAYEGRVNPKGIPCLYFSTDMLTAMAETRPWIGSQVSVAQFVMLRSLSIVDCSSDTARDPLAFEQTPGAVEGQPKWHLVAPNSAKWEDIVWGDINRAFSEPVTRTDDVADYAPTQVLAEVFRSAGSDGLWQQSRKR
jgi:hypothetical protein